MIRPHHAMDERLLRDLEESHFIQKPMPIHPGEAKENRCLAKPVLKSRLLDDMESLANWETVTEYAHLELSDKHKVMGEHSIRFTAPCKLERWTKNVGRIYTVPKALRRFDRENWEEYNRLSAWVYPDMPGYRNVCLRIQLHNDGAHVVPDAFDREGGHNVNLVNQQWNHITFEIPYVARDEVIGVSFDYDMVGHEPCATDTACWYLDKLELELVDPEPYEGWEVPTGRIAFSHSGYQTGAEKTAIASVLPAETFSLIDGDGKAAYEGPVQTVTTTTGEYRILDFSDFRKAGTYRIKAGEVETETFPIGDYVWMSSIWKTLNFFFCQRCGYRVPGKHDACHGDQRTVHGDRSITCNGGWHDAADTNQQFPLTCETTYALFDLAMAVKDEDTLLYRRLLSEGDWGLQYLLKGRFGDGYRVSPASSAVWTDGIRGTMDDLDFRASNDPFQNLLAASAEAIGSRALREEDPVLADYALRCAREDFDFGVARLDDNSYDPGRDGEGHDRMSSKCLLAGTAAHTALELHRITCEAVYAERAAAFGDYVVSCQQRQFVEGFSEPLVGYFYRDEHHKTVVHYNHRSHEEKYTLALIELCRQFPNHPHWMDWHSAVLLHADYLRRAMRFVAPYGMLPSGIYALDEIDDRDTFSLMHPLVAVFAGLDLEGQRQETFKNFREQLLEGVQVGPQHYMRRFPVWYSFRGNYHVQLSLGKAASATSVYLNDPVLYNTAQRQFEWIIGKNPFCESVMYGEGYDYGMQYAVLPGETVGELPVGMQSNEERDAPFWPQANNCTYKEVWVAAPAKWLWMMSDAYLPGRVVGECPDGGEVRFRHVASGEETAIAVVDGKLDGRLSAGTYEVSYGGQSRKLTVVSGRTYTLRVPLRSYALSTVRDGDIVRITIEGPDAQAALRASNLELAETVAIRGGSVTVEARVVDAGAPWAVAAIVDGDMEEILSAMG